MVDSMQSELEEGQDPDGERYKYWLLQEVNYRTKLEMVEKTIETRELELLAFLSWNIERLSEGPVNEQSQACQRIVMAVDDALTKQSRRDNYGWFMHTVIDLIPMDCLATSEEKNYFLVNFYLDKINKRLRTLWELYKDRRALRDLARDFPNHQSELPIHPIIKKLWDTGGLDRDQERGFFFPIKGLGNCLAKLNAEDAADCDLKFIKRHIKKDTGADFGDSAINKALGYASVNHKK